MDNLWTTFRNDRLILTIEIDGTATLADDLTLAEAKELITALAKELTERDASRKAFTASVDKKMVDAMQFERYECAKIAEEHGEPVLADRLRLRTILP